MTATALASEIADWVRGALAGIGMVTVQLRVVEPAGLPGIVMPGSPTPSDTGYRQEYQRGAAEDMGQIVDVANGVMVTRDWTPLEPDVIEEKTYLAGVGFVHEIKTGGDGAGTTAALIDVHSTAIGS